jgi:hypothetical protein
MTNDATPPSGHTRGGPASPATQAITEPNALGLDMPSVATRSQYLVN